MRQRLRKGFIFGLAIWMAVSAQFMGIGSPAVVKASDDEARIPLGVELNVLGSAHEFVDTAKILRDWEPVDGTGTSVPRDDDGWPLEDARTVFFDKRPFGAWWGGYDPENPQAADDPAEFQSDMSGVYKLSFKGQADISPGEDLDSFTIENKEYDPATNTTTADLVVPEGKALVIARFENTVYDAAEGINGIKDVKLIRPGYHDRADQTFTDEFLASLEPFSTLRYMDWLSTNDNNLFFSDSKNSFDWADRKLPSDATQLKMAAVGDRPETKGVAWEYIIELANTTGKDLWINIPAPASEQYIAELAELLHAELDPGLIVYVEYSNEVWNSMFPQYAYNRDAAVAEAATEGSLLSQAGTTNEHMLAGLRNAMMIHDISEIFKSVYGAEAINTVIRPVLTWQFGSASQFSDQLSWLNSAFAGQPSDYLYGIAGAPYIYDNSAPDATPEQIIEHMNAVMTNPSTGVRARTSALKSVANQYGIKLMMYEGGPDNAINSGKTNVGNKILANRHQGMGELVKDMLIDNYFSVNDGLFIYFAHAGYYSRWGSWGVVEDVRLLDTPKYNALLEVAEYLRNNPVGGEDEGEPGGDPGEHPGEDGEVLYENSFDNAEGWTIDDPAGIQITEGQLKAVSWSLTTQAISEDAFGGTYSFSVDTTPTNASGDWNATRVFFNYTDANNYYLLQIGNSPAGTNNVQLIKRENGTDLTLASNLTYPLAPGTSTVQIIVEETGHITVYIKKLDEITKVIDRVLGSAGASGKIGLGSRQALVNFDNVKVIRGIVTLEDQIEVPEYDLTIHVTSGGSPVEEASIAIGTDEYVTDADGTAVIAGLIAGSYDYTVSKDGYKTVLSSVAITDDDVTEAVELLAVYEAVFQVNDVGGAPLEGATVAIEGEDEATTDAAGSVTIPELANGSYAYTVSKEGYHSETGTIEINGEPAAETVVLAVVYEVTFTIADDEGPVENAVVTIDGTDYVTNSNGVASAQYPAGDYSYSVYKVGYAGENGMIAVVDQAVEQAITLTRIETYEVVFEVKDEQGLPIEDATIAANGETLLTDEAGTAVLIVNEGASLTYSVAKNGYHAAEQSDPIAIEESQTIEIELTKLPAYPVQFTVVNAYGPLSGAELTIGGETWTSDSNGVIDIAGLPSGSYSYSLVRIGYDNAEGTFELGEQPLQQSVTMTRITPPSNPSAPTARLTLKQAVATETAPAVFEIYLSSPAEQDTVIYYNVFGEAVNGVDYEPLSGSVTVAQGQSSATVAVHPVAHPEMGRYMDLTMQLDHDYSTPVKYNVGPINKMRAFIEGRELSDGSVIPMGINFSIPVDYSSEIPFVDLFKTSRFWPRHNAAIDYTMDSNGEILTLSGGELVTYMAQSLEGNYPSGLYTLLYDGEASFRFAQDARIHRSEPGRIEVEVNANSGIQMFVSNVNESNPVRNIRFIMPGYEDTYESNPWYPYFLKFAEQFSTFRFMNFMDTNDNPSTAWSERNTPDSVTQMKSPISGGRSYGVAVEYLIDLANRTGRDPWFNMPHLADDDYIEQFARLVKERLDPDLKIYVEYSNEVWNSQFSQTQHATQQGIAKGYPSGDARHFYYADRSVDVFTIWKDVFEQDNDRIVGVIATQAAQPMLANLILNHRLEDGTYVYEHTDALAGAPYFGGGVGRDASYVQQILDYTPEQILDFVEAVLLPETKLNIDEMALVANSYGIPLIAYEAGQHLVGAGGFENNAQLTQKLVAANRDPRMKELYESYLSHWKEAGGQLMAHYSSIRMPGQYGSWGLLEHTFQDVETAPKYQAVLQFIKENPTWWDDNEPIAIPELTKASVQKIQTPLTLDNRLDEKVWNLNHVLNRKGSGAESDNEVTFGLLWDEENLYIGVKVLDGHLYADSTDAYQDDSIELFIDGNHSRHIGYDSQDYRTTRRYTEGSASIDGGYTMEFAVPWSAIGITPHADMKFGFDIANNDDDSGGNRDSVKLWAGTTFNWADTTFLGELTLSDEVVLDNSAYLKGGGAVVRGGAFELIYGASAAEAIIDQLITIEYDAELFEFVSAAPIGADVTLESVNDSGDGTAHIRISHAEAFDGVTDLIRLGFKAKEVHNTASGTIAVTGAEWTADEDGAAIQANGFELSIIVDGFFIGTPLITDFAGNAITELTANGFVKVAVDITNAAAEAKEGTLIIALYNASNQIEELAYVGKTVQAGSTESLNAGFRLPGQVNGYTLKVFVWDNLQGMIPLSNVVTFPVEEIL